MSEEKGLYNKYETECGSFLLKPEVDRAAQVALYAYAGATDNQKLRYDLLKWMSYIEEAEGKTMSSRETNR